MVLGAIGAPVLTSCGGSEAHGIAPASDAALGADAAASYISSPVAGEHMGEDGIVKGTVQDYNYNKTGKVYTLIFDAPVGTRILKSWRSQQLSRWPLPEMTQRISHRISPLGV